MKAGKKFLSRAASLLCTLPLLVSIPYISANAAVQSSINYSFTVEKAGYAQGTITFASDTKGTFYLYWADGQGKILDGYYPIDTLKMNAGDTKNVTMGIHTAIPANAEKIVAVTSKTASPSAVYSLPQTKKLSAASGNKLYSFSSYSDIHVDKGSGWYVDAEKHLKEGLQYAVDMNSDYIVVSGDVVTNDSGPDKEWVAYQKILSQSSFVNPVWESDGNHDMRQGVESGIKSFIKNSGTDSVQDSNKPYFYKIEEKTGDIFIFMALEYNKNPNDAEEFSNEQLTWAENLINQYTAKKVNVFLIQHAPIKKFGAGDRMSDPYYKGLLNTTYEANAKYKTMIQNHPNVVWLSGHTHEDFEMDYNYSNENNSACHMIHIPSLAGSTKANSADDGLERNNGKGFNSQGYFTEVYQNEIVFYGVNLSDKLIYPKYSYIMESTRTESSPIPEATIPLIPSGKETDISAELAKVSSILSKYYTYSSYDQYQALKKLYYQYKGSTKADENVLAEFEDKINALSRHTGTISVNAMKDTYYFENNKSWSKVYGYAWDGSNKNGEWPGVQLKKAGESNGNDVYVIKFTNAGQYANLIFTDGSSQTVDIDLCDYSGNCFKLGSTTNGKYSVSNYTFTPSDSGEDDPPVINPDPPETEMHQYALLYYISGEHDWNDTNSLFTNKNGRCTYKFTSKSATNISFSLYDKTDKKYLSMSESASIVYGAGQTFDYTLVSQSSRGKSITVKEMAKDLVLTITYTPSNKSVHVLCGEEPVFTALANNSTLSSAQSTAGGSVTVTAAGSGGTAPYTYAAYAKLSTAKYYSTVQAFSSNNTINVTTDKAGTYNIRVKVKGSDGTIAVKDFDVAVSGTPLSNNSTISTTSIAAGGSVTVTGSAEGGTSPYQYALYSKKSTSSYYSTVCDYSASAAMTLILKDAGTYNLRTRVKDSSGSLSTKDFTVTVSSADIENNTTISASSILLGGNITITGAASGGTSPYSFAAYYKLSSSKYFSTIRDFSTSNTITFTPSASGSYTIRTKVKDSSGTINVRDFALTVTGTALTNNSSISSESISAGGSVTITGAASGGTSPYQFALYFKKSSASYYSTVCDYSAEKTMTLTLKDAGTYSLRTRVKDSSGKTASLDFTVTVTASELKNTSTISASTSTAGGYVTVTASGSGGTAPYTYAAYSKLSTASYYSTVQAFGSGNTIIIPTDKSGTYNIRVKVKDNTGKIAVSDFNVKVS